MLAAQHEPQPGHADDGDAEEDDAGQSQRAGARATLDGLDDIGGLGEGDPDLAGDDGFLGFLQQRVDVYAPETERGEHVSRLCGGVDGQTHVVGGLSPLSGPLGTGLELLEVLRVLEVVADALERLDLLE